jgi:hypothetical protein
MAMAVCTLAALIAGRAANTDTLPAQGIGLAARNGA